MLRACWKDGCGNPETTYRQTAGSGAEGVSEEMAETDQVSEFGRGVAEKLNRGFPVS